MRLVSGRKQSFVLEAPSEIMKLKVLQGKVSVRRADRKNQRRLSLSSGQEIEIAISL